MFKSMYAHQECEYEEYNIGILSISNGKGVKEMGYRGRRSYNRGPREMHKAICSDCGKECEVPFEPTPGRPVYCRECYPKHRPQRRW
jgi:CxxC-x17-CxxC domain-containing protein